MARSRGSGPSVADADPPGDAFDRLRLIRTSGVGPVTYRHLLQRFGGARAALDALPDLARRGGGRAGAPADPKATAQEIEAVARLGARHLFLGDPAYPPLLAQLDDAPPALTMRGALPPYGRPVVAMVGARNASAAACRFARGLAYELAAEGAIVVSGLARGIDTAAHMGAGASTVAVIAGGIDVAYPPENAALQERIAQEGLLLAEMPPGTEPRARHFPYRNRIIAGLAQGTIVVEAAPKSGSLITARLANELGREVMAVPGSPLDPRAQGCNSLIKQATVALRTGRSYSGKYISDLARYTRNHLLPC
jgi:DNA processing protein